MSCVKVTPRWLQNALLVLKQLESYAGAGAQSQHNYDDCASDDCASGDAPISGYATAGELGGTPNGDDDHDANHNGGRVSFALTHCQCR